MRGDSGFLYQDTIQAANDRACENYPAVSIEGHLLHVYLQGGEWHVWLNTEDMEFTGLCIGIAPTRDAAIAQAVAVCEAVAAELQKPATEERQSR